MAERMYLTRRGALEASFEIGKQGPGRYLVEGYEVERCRTQRPNGKFVTRWAVTGDGHFALVNTYTDALEQIAIWIDAEAQS